MRTIDHLRTTIQADTAAAAHMARAFAGAQAQVERFARSQEAAKQLRRRRPLVLEAKASRNGPCPNHPERKFKRCSCYREKPHA